MPCTLELQVETLNEEISPSIEVIQENLETVVETTTESLALEVVDSPCTGVDNQEYTFKAGSTISALTVVYQNDDGSVYPIDYRDEENIDRIVGITRTAALSDTHVKVIRDGRIDIRGLPLSVGRVWLGESGTLTQTPPENIFINNDEYIQVWDVLIGYVTSDSDLIIDVSESIQL